MYAPETSSPQSDRRDQVDHQYQEVVAARTAVLNREMVRMRGDGWSVQMAEDHLIATRKEAGRSQMERVLICVGGLLAIAYVATLIEPAVIDKIGVSKPIYFGGAVVIGALAALISGGQSARTRTVTVSVDGQGRPFTTDR